MAGATSHLGPRRFAGFRQASGPVRGGCRLTEMCLPVRHRTAAALEERRLRVSGLHLVLDLMGEAGLDDLPGMVRLYGCPVAEIRSEAVRHGVQALLPELLTQRHFGQRLATGTREHEHATFPECANRLEDLHVLSQRHLVVAVRLHALSGDGPHVVVEVDLVLPRRP